MLKVQAAASWTSGTHSAQSVLQSKLCLSEDVQTAGSYSIPKTLQSGKYKVMSLRFWFLTFKN